MIYAGGQDETHQCAQGAGEHHGADNYTVHFDAGVTGGALALAYNSDLIAMLAVLQIDVHKACHQSYDQNGQKILVAHSGQPTGLSRLVDDANLTGALRHLPNDDKVGGQLHGDVVHHQGKQRFVGVPLGLEESRQEAPQGTGQEGSDQRNQDQQGSRELVAQQDHAGGGGQAADKGLTFRTDVPEAHLESGGHSQGDTQQNGHITGGNADAARSAESTGKNGAVNADRIFSGQQCGDQATKNQSQQQDAAANSQCLRQRQGITLRNLK